MSKEEIILHTIIDAIPHWYECKKDNAHLFEGQKSKVRFCSHRGLVPELKELKNFAESKLLDWVTQSPEDPTPSILRKIREDLVLFWLRYFDKNIKWEKYLAYAERLQFRTYENKAISINLIIVKETGTIDIMDINNAKIIDPLAGSQSTYFKVDSEGRFISYDQIMPHDIKPTQEYKFYPDFIQSFQSILKKDDYSFHITSRGDILILKHGGMLASYRKGNWYIYSMYTLKNSLVDIVNCYEGDSYRVGCNLFDIVFDLSYRRHGALLVYDPKHKVVEQVVNKGSVLLPDSKQDLARKMLKESIYSISISNIDYSSRKKQILLEIAAIDGAIIFDKKNILAFGAMIATHPEADGQTGARTTAARSALLYGGLPVKISSDGDISLFFKCKHDAEAALHFM